MKRKRLPTQHGYGPPRERELPQKPPGVQIYYPRSFLPLTLNTGFSLLQLNGGYAVKQQYPDLKPGEINFILK